ncbi:LysR family transcriptional regulator [Lentzea pudingi]|uniref:LysR family transcriptional regulator n=1 Tax=Lentzea pudingi TaxID=1789439 RepID=A0ABQ2HXV1_9PSEU|nr:LysR family transcriptional regulator [Lentzea pudingi]
MNISNLDLNLLVALDALLQERSVTRAAARLGLTQPTLSASLARLRRHFRDDLLVRVGNRYELTPLSVRLRERTSVALDGVTRVFSVQPDFDPSASRREFSFLSSDYGAAVAGRNLSAALRQEAPLVRVRVEHISDTAVDNAEEALRSVDGLLLPHGFITGLPHVDLHHDRWVCVVSEDNTRVGATLSMEDLAESPWVVTFNRPTAFTPAMRQLELLGVEPRVQVVVESFLAIPFLVAGTDRVALMQRRLAVRIAEQSGLRVLECPFDAVPLAEALWWHPMYTHDPEHAWMREVLVAACNADLTGGP